MLHIPRIVTRVPILRGVARLMLTSYARLFKSRYVVENRMGLQLLLDQENIIDWQIFIRGEWEAPQFAKLFELLAQQRAKGDIGAIFLDVGAHWGLYALEALKSASFEQIFALEPDPTNFSQLQANLFLNDARGAVKALQLAASNAERTFGLSLRTHRNRGATQVVDVSQPNHVVCRGARLDSLFDFASKLLVVKIDVEGHEIAVLEGMTGLLAKNRCVLQIEVDDENYPGREEVVAEKLAPYGLKLAGAIHSDFFFVSE
jgi:FkbM family methyltransferase